MPISGSKLLGIDVLFGGRTAMEFGQVFGSRPSHPCHTCKLIEHDLIFIPVIDERMGVFGFQALVQTPPRVGNGKEAGSDKTSSVRIVTDMPEAVRLAAPMNRS